MVFPTCSTNSMDVIQHFSINTELQTKRIILTDAIRNVQYCGKLYIKTCFVYFFKGHVKHMWPNSWNKDSFADYWMYQRLSVWPGTVANRIMEQEFFESNSRANIYLKFLQFEVIAVLAVICLKDMESWCQHRR